MSGEPTNEEVMSEVKNVADMMARNFGDEDEINDDSALPTEDELKELAKKEDLDIFDDVINARLKAGLAVKYSIWVDNERVVSDLKGLAKWGDVHKKYAKQGGLVKVKVTDLNGKYIKSQTVQLGPYISDENTEVEKKADSMGITPEILMQMQAKSEERFQRMLDEQRKELKESSKEKVDLLTTVLGSKKDDSSSEMFKFMMQMQQQQYQAQLEEQRRRDEQQRRDQERADERFEKLLMAITSKDEGVDPWKEMQRIQEAEDRGYQKAERFYDLLDSRSEAKAKELADSKKDESVTDKAIKSVLQSLPAVTGLLSKRVGEQNAYNANPTTVRKELPQNNSGGGLGMATLSDDEPKVDQNANTDKIKRKQEDREAQILRARTAILETTLPIIGTDLMAEVNYVETASKVFEALADRNINPLLVIKLFTVDDFFMIADEQGLIAIAKEAGKEEQLKNWLKGFYKSIYEKTAPSQPRQSI